MKKKIRRLWRQNVPLPAKGAKEFRNRHFVTSDPAEQPPLPLWRCGSGEGHLVPGGLQEVLRQRTGREAAAGVLQQLIRDRKVLRRVEGRGVHRDLRGPVPGGGTEGDAVEGHGPAHERAGEVPQGVLGGLREVGEVGHAPGGEDLVVPEAGPPVLFGGVGVVAAPEVPVVLGLPLRQRQRRSGTPPFWKAQGRGPAWHSGTNGGGRERVQLFMEHGPWA